MSYVSAIPAATARVSASTASRRLTTARIRRPAADLLARTTSLVSTSLEAALLLAMMSGLSLVLCTIAAGAL